jgi:ABC-2 type transport system permease protein
MPPMLRIALHDLRLTLTDRSAVAWMVVLPLVFAVFFGLVMGGNSSGERPAVRVSLTVVDLDGGPVARRLVESLDSDRLSLREVTEDERRALDNPVRTLVIPAGFSASVLAGEEVSLRLEKEPDTSAEAAMVAQTRILRAVADVLGALVTGERQGRDPADGLPVVEHPAYVTVDSAPAGQARVIPDGFAQSVPGNAVMFVMLVALTYGAATITSERESGLLRRLVSTPISRLDIIGGKILGRLVVALVQVALLVAAYAAMSATGMITLPGSHLALWLVLSVYAIAVAPLGVAFGALFTDPDRAASIGVLSTMVMAAFGGCWWPLEIVPASLQKVATALPTGWAMRAAHGVISFGHPLSEMVPTLLPLIGFGVVFTVVAARRLRID